jgi:hypothetical protein
LITIDAEYVRERLTELAQDKRPFEVYSLNQATAALFRCFAFAQLSFCCRLFRHKDRAVPVRKRVAALFRHRPSFSTGISSRVVDRRWSNRERPVFRHPVQRGKNVLFGARIKRAGRLSSEPELVFLTSVRAIATLCFRRRTILARSRPLQYRTLWAAFNKGAGSLPLAAPASSLDAPSLA